MMTDLEEKIYCKSSNIVARKIAGDLFLVPIKGKLADMQRIFSLNAVGEFVWQSLDSEKNLEEIRDDIASTFGVDKETAAADIGEFIAELLRADLIAEKC